MVGIMADRAGAVQRGCARMAYPAISGRHVRTGVRQSIPSKSIESCAGVISAKPEVCAGTAPSRALGRTNRPRSSLFA